MAKVGAYVWKIIVAVFIFTFLQLIIGFFSLGEAFAGIGWIAVSNLLVVLVLTWSVVNSRTYGLRLVWPIILMFFGIYTFNVHVETLFFHITVPQRELVGMMVRGLLLSLIFSPILLILMDKVKQPVAPLDIPKKHPLSVVTYLWRIIFCMIAYVIIYFIAGALVYSYVKDFYAEMAHVPAMQHILFMQLLRGLVYVLVVIPIIRIAKTERLATAIMVGLLLSVLGGTAPLLFPNPYMPPYIRLVHGIEITISNFVFGIIIGTLLGVPFQKKKVDKP